MELESQQSLKNPAQGKIRTLFNHYMSRGFMNDYIDMIIRGVIMLITSLTIVFILRLFFNFSVITFTIIYFVLILLLTPLLNPILSKISYGSQVISWYLRKLDKISDKIARKT